MLQPIGQDIWTYDGPELVFAGAAMNTRMTIIRLSAGGLWIHSPIELTHDTRRVLTQIGGEVVALIAPNKFHHLYVSDWMEAFPQAQVFAESQVQKKIPALRSADTLTDNASDLYGADIDQVLVSGNRLFQEVVFFHRTSQTLLMTDLMINLPIDHIKGPPRWFLQFEGVTYPNGGIPRLYRWLTTDAVAMRRTVDTIKGWQAQQMIFAHGKPLPGTVAEILEQQFAWLDR